MPRNTPTSARAWSLSRSARVALRSRRARTAAWAAPPMSWLTAMCVPVARRSATRASRAWTLRSSSWLTRPSRSRARSTCPSRRAPWWCPTSRKRLICLQPSRFLRPRTWQPWHRRPSSFCARSRPATGPSSARCASMTSAVWCPTRPGCRARARIGM